MTPEEELIKLCDAADRLDTGFVGRLNARGFMATPDGIARARSYAALWAALDDPATCGNWRANGRTCLEMSKANQNWDGLCPRCEALATGGTK